MAVKPPSPSLSWVEALSWIVASSFVFSVVAQKTIRYGFSRNKQEVAKVEYVIQTGLYKEALDSEYLMEVLGLSMDKPILFSHFNPEEALERLLSSPVIEQAYVKKIKPNMVYIDYTLRKPLFWAADFFNAALDKEGTLFPMHPFFSPKKLPEIYLGKEGGKFGDVLKGEKLDLARAVLEVLEEEGNGLFFVKRIDVSKGFDSSLGKREIVAVLEEETFVKGSEFPLINRYFLRLSQKGFRKEIGNYLNLREHLVDAEKQEVALLGEKEEKEISIDLRLSQLAFIE
jgi:hypothetical protein